MNRSNFSVHCGSNADCSRCCPGSGCSEQSSCWCCRSTCSPTCDFRPLPSPSCSSATDATSGLPSAACRPSSRGAGLSQSLLNQEALREVSTINSGALKWFSSQLTWNAVPRACKVLRRRFCRRTRKTQSRVVELRCCWCRAGCRETSTR